MTPFRTPAALAFPLVALAAGLGAIVFALVEYWGANPEYVDRFLILLGAGYAAWVAWPQLRELIPTPARLGFVPLIAGATAFPVGWFLQAQVGPKPVVLWWLAVSWVATACGFLLLTGGWSHLRQLAFPLAFVLFALPVPNRILVPLQFWLQSTTTSVAEWTLPVLGVPVERSGFILSLPGGDLGVAEACSGVRSVTALTAIAAFVAWWNGFRFPRGILLVLLSIPVIAAVNAVRVIASGLIQENAGVEYVRGEWHDGLGIGMVLLGLGLIVLLANWLSPHPESNAATPEVSEPHWSGNWRTSVTTATIVGISLVGTISAQLLGVGAERELVAAAPIDEIPHTLGSWKGEDVPVPDEISEMLTQDAIVRRVYRDFGYEVHVWVIYWSSRNMVKGYHHPDVCWPNRGFDRVSRDIEAVEVGGGTLPITVREFIKPESDAAREPRRQLILYWTQEGRRVWTEAQEKRVRAAGDSHDWLGERLFERDPGGQTGRLVVLLGTETWGDEQTRDTIRTQTIDLAQQIAVELYRVCPWAAPRES